ncbi:hypothetical protein [Pajaroellobacter abortibovis]|nr:hypothetical protein [Pajaroellobacter abortibovis]
METFAEAFAGLSERLTLDPSSSLECVREVFAKIDAALRLLSTVSSLRSLSSLENPQQADAVISLENSLELLARYSVPL